MKNKNKLLNNKRLKILKKAKRHIPFDGWNEKIFLTLAKELEISASEINFLFPKNYKDLLDLYLEEKENQMIKGVKKLNFSNLRTQEKLSQIIMLRIKKNSSEKELVRKTFFYLSLPQNCILGISSIFRTVDNIWYLTGDKTSDFNYYTKRIILAGIYSSVLLFWLNRGNKSLKETEDFLIKKIKKTSIVKKIKNSFIEVLKDTPNMTNLTEKFRKLF